MMQLHIHPDIKHWKTLTERPGSNHFSQRNEVKQLMEQVKQEGDHALRFFSKKWDGCVLDSLAVDFNQADDFDLSQALKTAIVQASQQIHRFHQSQWHEEPRVETSPGVICWRKNIPLETVGLYIPGGTAPLFSSLLMLAIPAKIAGCKNIVVCTPPQPDGGVHPAILFAAKHIGITQLFRVGGAQAIAALTYGTESIPKCDKILGPGNSWVTCAKQLAQQEGVSIDMPAGPSELLIIADQNAHPEWVAADLLSQAEHGKDSQVILLTNDSSQAKQIIDSTIRQLENLPRKQIAEAALKNSHAIVFDDLSECMNFSNLYAPEHLILAVLNPEVLASEVQHAGSVFLGYWSCESAGDYASGTNHTLPTAGYARQYSGVSVDSFLRKTTFQQLTAEGLRGIGKSIETMAEAEGLFAHKNAVSIRLKSQDS